MYIPIDSCKHRPPNAEIKVFASDGGAIVPSEQQGGTTAALKLAFVPKEDEEDYTEVAANGSLSAAANSLGPPAEDPASDFMPDTNKSYADEGIPGSVALGRSSTLSRTGSISRLGGGYPSSLAPSSRPDRRLGAVPASDTNSHSGAGLERTHSRTGSVGASTSASASAASSGFVAPKGPIHVSKVPAEKLKFFTPSEKRRAMTDDGERKPTFGVGPGHPDYQPGDSGLDDLLKQRSDEAPEDRPRKSAAAPTANARPSLLSHVSDLSSTATSDNHDVDSDADWKPNVWKFGESRSRSARGSESRPSVGADSGGVVFDAGIESDRHHAPSAAGDHLSASVHAVNGPSSYAGWNDAPPPDAIVAKAYDGGAGYRKRQHQKHHRLLHDLAAGLPANTGAASKWARPINFGDSLPPSVPVASGSIGRSGAISPLPPGGKGFGRLLNDTIRGRISVEGALGAALDEVRTKTALDLPHHEAARQARPPATPVAPPPKVSLVNDGATSQNQRPSSREHELNKFVAAGGHADGDTRAGGPSGGLAPSASPWRSGSGQQPRARHRSQADKDD
ncbi:uncharacterized protein PSFLO_03429 [Pseudozyma flocculosa]|nr:uncharacterized protein PSFLO_03429 [Pseudozyma flocculosa]